MQTNEITAQRVGRNQATFRTANEEIKKTAQQVGAELPTVPFICECPDTACTRTTRLSFSEYETVRSEPTHFLVVEGHETCVVDGEEVARVHARNESHTVMEKIGVAGDEARRLDPRS